MAYPNMDMKIPRARENNLLESDEMETPSSSSENKSANTNITDDSDDRIVATMDVGPEEDDDDNRSSVGLIQIPLIWAQFLLQLIQFLLSNCDSQFLDLRI